MHFAGLDTLGADERKSYLRALLYPARLIYSWMTGGMASNDEAVAFLIKQQVAGLDVDLVAAALSRFSRLPHCDFPPGVWKSRHCPLNCRWPACQMESSSRKAARLAL